MYERNTYLEMRNKVLEKQVLPIGGKQSFSTRFGQHPTPVRGKRNVKSKTK